MQSLLFLTVKSCQNYSHKQIENEDGLEEHNYKKVNEAGWRRHRTGHLKYLGFLLGAGRNFKPVLCRHKLKDCNDGI